MLKYKKIQFQNLYHVPNKIANTWKICYNKKSDFISWGPINKAKKRMEVALWKNGSSQL